MVLYTFEWTISLYCAQFEYIANNTNNCWHGWTVAKPKAFCCAYTQDDKINEQNKMFITSVISIV